MPAANDPRDADIIDLEPTIQLERGPAPAADGVALVQGTIASFSAETGSLRRTRIGAAALLFTIVYFVLFIWNITDWAETVTIAWPIMILRFLLSAAVLGLILSPLGRSARWVRALEIALFGGLTLLLFASQYFVDLQLLRSHHLTQAIAFIKNGVIQAIFLMILFGMFVPNRPLVVAWSLLGMAIAPMLALSLLGEHPDLAEEIAELHRVSERIGTNMLFLLLAAGVSFFGSLVLNGLRSELHEARKFGQYRLLHRIGAGGMGEVYKAEHALLKRPCALKLIRPEAGSDPLALARFEREVQASARLAHHNTIEIYDYGHTDDGTFYYVMEYLQGMNLAELIQKSGPLPPGRVIYIFRQVCAGLAEAHSLGLIHRDLKPANVYIARLGGETDVAKILDFGLVKVTQDPHAAALTAELSVSGTPLYMAPEQAMADKSMDARADIYALGAMMYHALTGQPPFEGDSPVAVMLAHAKDPVVPPSQVVPSIPADLEAVVMRCLAKKAADRYPDVRSLGEALAQCQSAADWGPRQADAWWNQAVAVPAELELEPSAPSTPLS